MTQPRQANDQANTLADALRQHLHEQTGQPVTLIETHISWLLLAGDFAYKLKKPVRLPFVDFSTLASRRHFCLEELRLNRRFAPSLYLDCLPVIGPTDAPSFGQALTAEQEPSADSALDYVVRMRRFPSGALAAERLAAGQLHAAELRQLGTTLAQAHANAPRANATNDSDKQWGSPAEVFGAVESIISQLADLAHTRNDSALQNRISTLGDWLHRHTRRLRPAALARQRQGLIRECHGDLHLGNVVCLPNETLPFDCLEFDPALRWIDPMADLAFTSMDLKAHGRPDLAAALLDAYMQESGDWPGLCMLRFYEVYRALVRAMVALLRSTTAADAAADTSAPDYLACAEALAQAEDLRHANARLLITHGFSGSGKSTIAQQLLETAHAVRLRSDVERKRLFGLHALQSSRQEGIDIYTREASRRTFGFLADAARLALRAGYPVIVDAAFLRQGERLDFAALARHMNVPFHILDCQATPAVLRARVTARQATGKDASEAGVAVLEQQMASHEALDANELKAVIAVDTEAGVNIAETARRWGQP